MRELNWLAALTPPEAKRVPPLGRRIQWPGEDREWIWNGTEWIARRLDFDGGDLWMLERDEAA